MGKLSAIAADIQKYQDIGLIPSHETNENRNLKMSKIDIVKVLADPSVRYWVKSSINRLLERDPLDACKDADLVARIFKQRWEECLEEMKAAETEAPQGWECVEAGVQ